MRRNLTTIWLDYRKAFDSIPHSWLIKSLKLAKVPDYIINAIENLTQSRYTILHLNGNNENVASSFIKISKGIYQGDSLSVMLFVISLNTLSYLLRMRKGYAYGKNRQYQHTNNFFVDDLKLFATNMNNIKCLLDIVTLFSKDTGMEFGVDKCAFVQNEKGKEIQNPGPLIINDLIVKPLSTGDTYTYLGIDENITYDGPMNKARIIKEYLSRVKKIWSSELSDYKKRVILHGQCSSWKNIVSGVPQGSVLAPLLFLIYINDLPNGLVSICKIFADDTSIFSKVFDKNSSQIILNNDLSIISEWAFQWKMQFNPDPNKQANEVYFSRKSNAGVYLPVDLNNSPVQLCESQKHLGIVLDKHLNFHEHIAKKIKICNKLIGTIKHLSFHLPRKSLLTVYKSFVRPHLDYGDIIYDNPENETLINKLEKVQYQACLAITGAFQGTSRESLYRKLGLECLQTRRWYRKMIFFYKILNGLAPKYLFDILPVSKNRHYSFRNQSNLELSQFFSRTKSFSNSFFPYCIKEWKKLDTKIKNLPSLSTFKKALLVFCKTEKNSLFNVHNPIGVKYLNRLRLNFSHLNEHKFHHNFRDTVNPLCCCNTETETTSHYLLRCHLLSEQITKLLENFKNLDNTLLSHRDDELLQILLYGSHKFSSSVNNKIWSLTIEFLESTKRFDKPLF